MRTIKEAKTTGELTLLVDQLGETFRSMRAAGGLSVQDVQQVASSLTRLQLLLNELERVEVHGKGASRDAVERFVELEGRIRFMRGELYDELRRDAASLSDDA